MPEVKKILVRGTNWLGDAVMTIPALQRLRSSFPHAQIALLAPPRAAELFADVSLIDEIFIYRRKEQGISAFFAALRKLRAEKFDLAILFQSAFEAALLAFLGGANARIGYATQGRSALLTHSLDDSDRHRNRHQTNDYLDLVIEAEKIYLGAESSVRRENFPSLNASPAQLQAAENLLLKHELSWQGKTLIALNAGATNSRAKCWPEDRFASLADRLINDLAAQIVFIGAPAERQNADRILAQMSGAESAKNLAGATSIEELIGLLANCDLVVTNDTGPAHVAAALGRPTLTIFGPTNEFETAPLGVKSELIRAEGIECARCMHRDCPIDHRCMTMISVDDIAKKSHLLLTR